FSDKLGVTASWFQEKRNNILWRSGIVPASFGGTVPAQNLGRVSNEGYEIEVSWNDNIGKLSYFLKGNYSFARNRIDYMAEAPFPYEWMNQTGFSIGQNRGLLSNGFYNTQQELNNRPFNTYGNNARLGDIKYIDVTGDGIINQNDQVPIGYSNLPQVAYNLTIGFNYKGFDLNALFIGTAKGSFSQFGYILNTPFAQTRGQVLKYAYDGRWTPEKTANGESVTFPAYSFSGGGPNIFSDFWLRPNDFKRLKNLEIGYTFDRQSSFLTRATIKSIRIYANGNNILTWGTGMIKGIDPEMTETSRSREGYSFPLTKTYNVGVNVQF
ncbi:MAG TPA: hypothetical protein VK625_20575, partial [Flavitalea sp.]|nr:hypothetical protein [Flavitalea sp.]